MSLPSPWIEVDTDRIRRNVEAVRATFPGRRVIGVIKSNGYGHGIVAVARALGGRVDAFAVVEMASAVRMRQAGIRERILVLAPFTEEAYRAALRHEISLSVNDDDFPRKIRNLTPGSRPVGLHIQLNTGMNRHGISPRCLPALVRGLITSPLFTLQGIYSNPSGAATAQEESRIFDEALAACPDLPSDIWCHFGNSAVLLSHPETLRDTLRFGILAYGLFPRDRVPRDLPIRPALSWKARISLLRDLPAGSVVGYGGCYRTDRPLRLAVVSCGYGYGYLRRFAGQGGTVLVGGRRAPLLAPPNMNDMMVDVSGIDCHRDDEVVLLGRQGDDEITAAELADRLGTIEAEVLCLLDRTPHRLFVRPNAPAEGRVESISLAR